MHKQVTRAGLFFLLWIFVATPANAQFGRRDTGLYIRGYVRVEPNLYASGVKVDLKRQTGQILNSDYSRFNGQFEFYGLPGGLYYLTIDIAGFLPVRQEVEIRTPPGVNGVTLLLQPEAGAKPGNVPSVSARALAIPEKARKDYLEAEDALATRHDAQKAIGLLQNAVRTFPGFFEAYQLLGIAFLEKSKAEDAEAAFRKSIEISKQKYAPALYSLAALMNDRNSFDKAEPIARDAVTANNARWQGHFELSRALFGLSRFEEAEASAGKVLDINPGLARGYLLRAKIYQGLKDYPAMLTDVDEFLRREPKGATSDEIRKVRKQLAKALRDAGMEVPGELPQ